MNREIGFEGKRCGRGRRGEPITIGDNLAGAISGSGQKVGDWELGFDGVRVRVRRERQSVLDEIAISVFGFGAFSITSYQATTTYFRDGSSRHSPTRHDRPQGRPLEELTDTVSVLGFLELFINEKQEIYVKHRLDQRQWIINTRTNLLRVTLQGETEPTVEFQFEQQPASYKDYENKVEQLVEELPVVEALPVVEEPPAFRELPVEEELPVVEEPKDPAEPNPKIERDDPGVISLLGARGKAIRFFVPFELNPKELKILELLAKYGKMTEKSLSSALKSRRPVRIAIRMLEYKFLAIDVSLINQESDTQDEGRIYAFNYEAAERLGVSCES